MLMLNRVSRVFVLRQISTALKTTKTRQQSLTSSTIISQIGGTTGSRTTTDNRTMNDLLGLTTPNIISRHFAQAAASSTIGPSTQSSRTSKSCGTTGNDRYADLVKETIKKMMFERDYHEEDALKPITDDELRGKFDHYERVFHEAELCLQDLQDSTPGAVDYLDECECAKGAVNHAFSAYVDLLEDLRRANVEQLKAYHEARNAHACNLKRLRQHLDTALALSPSSAAAPKKT